jgi:hypothetical protein
MRMLYYLSHVFYSYSGLHKRDFHWVTQRRRKVTRRVSRQLQMLQILIQVCTISGRDRIHAVHGWKHHEVSQSMITMAQSDHEVSTKTRAKPSHSQPNHLIERGYQTACNRKLGYHGSCTLCKGLRHVSTHSDFITHWWLENPFFVILYTSFGVWPRYHYMTLQRSTLDHMSYFPTGFPLLGATEYPHAPFNVTKVSHHWVQQNALRPLLHLAAF